MSDNNQNEAVYDETEQQERDRIRDQQIQLIYAYRETFTTEAGKKVLEHLKAFAGYGFPSYVVGNPTAKEDAMFFDGRKDIVALIENQINVKLPSEEEKPLTAE